MTIKGTFPKELTGKDAYRLTAHPNMVSMTTIDDGKTLTPDKWCHFVKNDTELLSAIFEEDAETIYITASTTFINSFMAIVECMDGEPFTIKKVSGKSKSNRTFINCELI